MISLNYLNRIKHLNRTFNKLNPTIISINRNKTNSSKKDDEEGGGSSQPPSSNLGDFSGKYQVFRDQDSDIILDVFEERQKQQDIEEEVIDDDPFQGLNLNRGLTGVFEIEDLVEVLKRENAEDIFVASVPKEIKYVNYIVVVNGKSVRHMQAIAQFVRKVYKRKMKESDLIPKIEGEKSNSWMALDLGNIALHIFSREARLVYDLDSLWAVGAQFDAECNKEDPVVAMLEKHSTSLHDFQPAS